MKSSCSSRCCTAHWQLEKIACQIQRLFSLKMEGVHNAQDALFQAWTAYSSLSTSIMPGDVDRMRFMRLTM
ncbi:hypothetical protein TNCV_2706301 [Trichonephila clavipes]|nr:hypothetical protein TNCV_2706301 [Trichonephila clavipes]